jgi:hypothetical protein
MIAVTIRIGKVIQGMWQAMAGSVPGAVVPGTTIPWNEDWLLELAAKQSLLIVAPPNRGKTTLLREAARCLSRVDETTSHGRIVVVVDKSNELGGDGLAPHAALGPVRWIPVGDPARQHACLIEAVENHAPDLIIVDEITSRAEVEACRTIVQRGVRVIASVHGTQLLNLLGDPERVNLLGGISKDVTISDRAAAARTDAKKVIRQRRGEPVFGAALELHGFYDWRVYTDVAAVVDAYLQGQPARAQRHVREEETRLAIVAEDGFPVEGDLNAQWQASRRWSLPQSNSMV